MLRQLAFKMFYDFVVHHSHQNGIVQVTLTAVWGLYKFSIEMGFIIMCAPYFQQLCFIHTPSLAFWHPFP